jgi:hypothetical protein
LFILTESLTVSTVIVFNFFEAVIMYYNIDLQTT